MWYTLVFEKLSGLWRLVHAHASEPGQPYKGARWAKLPGAGIKDGEPAYGASVEVRGPPPRSLQPCPRERNRSVGARSAFSGPGSEWGSGIDAVGQPIVTCKSHEEQDVLQ